MNLAETPLVEAADPGWTPIGDVGAANVWWPYQVQTYEFTNAEYVAFLNAIDPDGTNPKSVYNSEMTTSAHGGIMLTSSNPAGSKYSIKAAMGDKPVNFVTWYDAARVANWMHNGSKTFATTASSFDAINYGAYNQLAGPITRPDTKKIWSRFWVPSLDEWAKAAFYKGGSDAGYWAYATQSDEMPGWVGTNASGSGSLDGINAVTDGNYANWNGDANAALTPTTVGTNGGPSNYGVFDMSGNVAEYCHTSGSAIRINGGSWNDTTLPSTATFPPGGFVTENATTGFRLAREIYNSEAVWTGAAKDGLWGNPNNWFGDSLPSTANTKMWIKDQQFGSQVTIDATTHATIACDVLGPDWGSDLDIIGGSLTQLSPGGFLFNAGSYDSNNRAVINVLNGGSLQAHNLLLGDNWWSPAPHVTMTVDGASTVTVTDWMWLGGHLDVLDGTVDIAGGVKIGEGVQYGAYANDITRLNIENGTVIIRGMDISSSVDTWKANGWLTAYEGAGQLMVDTNTIPGGTILTAVAPVPEPRSIVAGALGATLLGLHRIRSRCKTAKKPQ